MGITFSIQFIERDLRKRGDVDQDVCIHGAPTPEPLSRLPKYEGATNLRYEQRSMNAETQEKTILNTHQNYFDSQSDLYQCCVDPGKEFIVDLSITPSVPNYKVDHLVADMQESNRRLKCFWYLFAAEDIEKVSYV